MRPRPLAAALLTAVLLAAGLSMGASTALAAPVDCTNGFDQDVNGDGLIDVVAGDPTANSGAGSVSVRYGSVTGLGGGESATLTQGDPRVGETAEAGDGFGSSVRMGLLDDDSCADLAIGVPGEDVDGVADVGLVEVVFGAPGGIGTGRPSVLIPADDPALALGATAGEKFGSALSLRDPLWGDPTLAVGVPGHDEGTAVGSGAVDVLTMGPDGAPASSQVFTQSTPGVPGGPETADAFGSALAWGRAELYVGTPGEDLSAGAVTVINYAGDPGTHISIAVSEQTAGVVGGAEAGDRFGAALSFGLGLNGENTLAVGVPGEDIGSVVDAGALQEFYDYPNSTAAGGKNRLISQDTAGVAGGVEAGDAFGSSVLAGTFYLHQPDSSNRYTRVVVVGVPGEDLGTVADAGAVSVLTVGDVPNDRPLTQDTTNVPGIAEAGEHFGAALGATGNELLIGVPDDVGASRGLVIGLSWNTLSGGHLVTPSTWSPAGGSGFGASIG